MRLYLHFPDGNNHVIGVPTGLQITEAFANTLTGLLHVLVFLFQLLQLNNALADRKVERGVTLATDHCEFSTHWGGGGI